MRAPRLTPARSLILATFALAVFALPMRCAFGAAVAAKPTVASVLDAAIARAQALIEKDLAPKVPGVSVAVAVNGELVWSQGFGYADVAAKAPVTTGTRFRIGSISKPLTAAGLALLWERGKVDLDAPVRKYVPEYPHSRERITTRQLAGHLSGIRHYKGGESLLNRPFASVRDGLTIFQNDPLEAVPGTKYIYSTYGWTVISAVMESAAQEEFVAFMETNVLRPLQMVHTRADRAGVTDADLTKFYGRNPAGKFVRAPVVDSSYKWAGGGFVSTPEDLVRFGSAHLQAGFLQKKTLDLLFSPQRTSDGKRTAYGVGWFVGKDDDFHEVLYHGGNSVGGTSMLLLHPSTKTVVAITCNLTQASLGKGPAQAIAEIFAAVKRGK